MQLSFAGMIRIGRATLGALTLASALAGGQSWAQPADLAGVQYPGSLKIEGANLVLNGSGISYRAVVKLYTVGLYVPQKSSKPEMVFASNGPKVLRFVMLQGMRVDELGKVITRGIEMNSSREEFFRLIPSIRMMGEQFAHIRRLNANDVMVIEYVPKRGTVFYVNGQPVGLPLVDSFFFPAVLRTWLGVRPSTQDLKDALLDYKPPVALDALN
jgi:Chalcone isomerase-like